jgi:hypothetical protein
MTEAQDRTRLFIGPGVTAADIPSPTTLAWKIDLFEKRVRTWQLEPARLLTEVAGGGFAALSVIMSYFEMVAQHEQGKLSHGASKENFIFGLRRAFFDLEALHGEAVSNAIAETMYIDIRCGLYHSGSTGPRVLISNDYGVPFAGEGPVTPAEPKKRVRYGLVRRVFVNPRQFVERVIQHFDLYLSGLRNEQNAQLRESFERRFDAVDS